MPIIAKNLVIGKVEESKVAPPENKFINVFDKIREQAIEQEKKVSVVVKNKPEPEIENSSEQDSYKHVHHGDLHRLFNTKSNYLKDMIGLEN